MGEGKGGKGKGGKGKGGKGKGGKGAGARSLQAFMTEDYHPPLPPLPLKDEVQELHERVDILLDKVCSTEHTTPSADALDLGDEAFPALGMSKCALKEMESAMSMNIASALCVKEKGVEEKKAVSRGGSQAASMNKFMRKAYGCATPR